MSCNSTEALFERFLDGKLATAQSDAVLTHVDRCADCRGVLEELRVVDALLNQPRQVELAPNFTFAMMAEAHALRAPSAHRAPLRAYLVSYLAGAWLLAAAALWVAPQIMHALAGASLEIARSITDASGGLGAVIARSVGRSGSVLTALLGALLTFDAMLVVGCAFALKYVRPRWVERLRS